MTIDPLPYTFLLSSPDLLSGLASLRLRFPQVPDIRMGGRVRHRIDEVLMVAFCSMLSDNAAFTDMENCSCPGIVRNFVLLLGFFQVIQHRFISRGHCLQSCQQVGA